MTNHFNKEHIENIIPGYWYRAPKHNDWYVDTVTISKGQLEMERNKSSLFIAMDSDTWHKGSKNIGIYSGWKDTHLIAKKYDHLIAGVIAQRPITEMDERIPQYIADDTYESINQLAKYAFNEYTGKVIGITGTAGKSTSKDLLNFLLEEDWDIGATRGNHNTRTGVPLTVACAITDPDYLVIESAISGLWTKPYGIMKSFPPDVALITSIDGGQNKTAYETAKLKAKIAESMNHQGCVVVNKESKEIDTLMDHVGQYNRNIITYGLSDTADSYIVSLVENKTFVHVTASIMGETIEFKTRLLSKLMILNLIGVLTTIKLLQIPLEKIVPRISAFNTREGVQSMELIQNDRNENITIIDDSWNATGIAMIEAIDLFQRQSAFFKGKKIAILGRIENLGAAEAKRQHEALVEPIIKSKIDIVFAHGPEMKYVLNKLPETLIGGYFEDAKMLAKAAAQIVDEDTLILLKGSPRSSDFKHVKRHLILNMHASTMEEIKAKHHPYATGSGAMTIDAKTGNVVGMAGDVAAEQNQGLGNILLMKEILQLLFAKKVHLSDTFIPGKQALQENKSLNSLPLKKGQSISVLSLITAAMVRNAPNALIMLANQVIGDNKQALQRIKEIGTEYAIEQDVVRNLTGRRITSKKQTLTLPKLYKAASALFDQFPGELSLLSQQYFQYEKNVFRVKTNLFNDGLITHGIFYGYLDSIGIVLSNMNGKKYITTVLGATDPYERDQLIVKSLQSIDEKDREQVNEVHQSVNTDKDYTINIIGDTYFGEFYTDIRKKHGKEDALQKYGRNYSFDKIRGFLQAGNFTISNFEAAITNEKEHPMRASKPFILYADDQETIPALEKEAIDLVTLANNHLMDCGINGLNLTLDQFEQSNIAAIGVGRTQVEAERPYIKMVNGQRVAIFNGYWYRNPMYFNYDFYAIGDQAGVACLSGTIMQNIQSEKAAYPDGLVIVIAHWGADFKMVSNKQREYAYTMVDAGADIIIGHGAHMMQEIEKYEDKYIVYSIGNGVFNSNGEYNRRDVAPYSFIAQLVQTNGWELRLYPIYSNNLKTFWQTRFLVEVEAAHCAEILRSYGSSILKMKIDKDGRYYFSMEV